MVDLRTRGGTPARELWTLEADRFHLNHGSYGGVTHGTAQRQLALQEEMRRVPGRWFAHLTDRLDEAVSELSRVLGLPRRGVVPVPNASAAATVAFRALHIPRGATVLVNNHNYGAVIHALRRAAHPSVRIEVVDVPLAATREEILALYTSALTPSVQVVLLDQFTSSTAMAFPLDALVPLVQESGARVVVDGSHAPGLLQHPFPDPAPDVWFGNLHKHLCAPLSGALLFLAEDLHVGAWPVVDSWNANEQYRRRFLIQGAVDATAVLAAPFAYAELEQVLGWDRIRAHAQTLTHAARTLLDGVIADRWGITAETHVASPTPQFALLKLPQFGTGGMDLSAHLRAALSREAGIEAMVVGWGGDHYLRLCSHAHSTMEGYEALATLGVEVLDRWRTRMS